MDARIEKVAALVTEFVHEVETLASGHATLADKAQAGAQIIQDLAALPDLINQFESALGKMKTINAAINQPAQ